MFEETPYPPGPLLLQLLCRFRSLVDDLWAVGVFDGAFIRRHRRPQRLLRLLVAVVPTGAALCPDRVRYVTEVIRDSDLIYNLTKV